MARVLVLIDYYLPGYKAGGPLRTIGNIVEQLGDQYEFWIVTRDRDVGDPRSYPGINIDSWNRVGKGRVYYASSGALSCQIIRRLVHEVNPDIVYLNSFFAPISVRFLVGRWLRLLPRLPIILAPRGEFSPGALLLKRRKKRAYLFFATRLGWCKDLLWHASSSQEEGAVRAIWGPHTHVHIAPNLVQDVGVATRADSLADVEHSSPVKLVFLSRITRKKNLLFVLPLLGQLQGDVVFHIYGPLEDQLYWRLCQQAMDALPSNIQVSYQGIVPHERVASVFANYDFLVLPTLGENFGHVIFEAMSAGCPVLISDQTPWRQLADLGVGWDIPLGEIDRWRATLQACVNMSASMRQHLANQARHFALRHSNRPDVLQQNVALFRRALDGLYLEDEGKIRTEQQ